MPAKDIFLTAESAKEILKRQGNPTGDVLGIFAPQEKDGKWMVVVRFQDVGYVKDDDAGKLNADEILNSYKEGTNSVNEERKAKGIPPFYVGGWAEKPRYQKDKHEVIWAIQVKEEDKAEAPVVAVNYNTRVLGRRGVLSLNLVTSPETLETDKPSALALLDQTSFAKGESYADYQPGKDKSAGYGIAGLILGGGALAAAAKFGFLGVAGKWLIGIVLVLKKFIILIIAGAGAALSKFFGKKKKGAEASPPHTPTSGPPGPPSMP